jgi:hypothetical protein
MYLPKTGERIEIISRTNEEVGIEIGGGVIRHFFAVARGGLIDKTVGKVDLLTTNSQLGVDGFLSGLLIKPEGYRNLGIGKLLLRSALDEAMTKNPEVISAFIGSEATLGICSTYAQEQGMLTKLNLMGEGSMGVGIDTASAYRLLGQFRELGSLNPDGEVVLGDQHLHLEMFPGVPGHVPGNPGTCRASLGDATQVHTPDSLQ